MDGLLNAILKPVIVKVARKIPTVPHVISVPGDSTEIRYLEKSAKLANVQALKTTMLQLVA